MKTNKKYFIFALLIAIFVITLPKQSVAGDEKVTSSVLANGSEMKFASYIGSTIPGYTKNENWSIIEDVVTLYNHKPSQIKIISTETVLKFQTAVAELGNKLVLVNSKEALQWKRDLEKTASAVRFIRNFDINALTADQIETTTVEVPVSGLSM